MQVQPLDLVVLAAVMAVCGFLVGWNARVWPHRPTDAERRHAHAMAAFERMDARRFARLLQDEPWRKEGHRRPLTLGPPPPTQDHPPRAPRR